MNWQEHSKVQDRHRDRLAYLYVRQSTLRQVLENTESTQRQYALQQRAIALGWRPDQVVVIDADLGRSGASTVDREGFQRLVTEVSLGRAGIVMGLEVSRLARNSTDWHRLLEICALSDSLILDEDGVYDPAHFNDRLLLGLKGTMSEAELHVLKARLRGGILNKARRGELVMRLPVGLVYDAHDRVRLDPDLRIQGALRQLFRLFEQTGSAAATVKAMREQGLLFPHRAVAGPHKGEVLWSEIEHSRALWVLHNPRYAGAFTFGRSRQRRLANGKMAYRKLPVTEWIALIHDAHEGYLTWADYERNLQQLRTNAQAYGAERERGAPRDGPALLQGLVICARCGERMTVRYDSTGPQTQPIYICQRAGIAAAKPICQTIPGAAVDAAIGELLVAMVSPLALQAALAVQQELEAGRVESDTLRRHEVEQAKYDSDLARRRYMQVDPDHRLVADTLEAEWNAALRRVEEAQQHYEQRRQAEAAGLTDEQRANIVRLAQDFPQLWRDPATPQRERKRMARLLIADVTLLKSDGITVQLRLHGGTIQTLQLDRPKPAWERRQTPAALVAEIDRLLDEHTDGEVATLLNVAGRRSGDGRTFNRHIVQRIRTTYQLRDRRARLVARGLLSLDEIAGRLNVTPDTIKHWRRAGLLRAQRCTDRNEFLFEPPGADAPIKYRHQGKALTRAKAGRANSSPSTQ